MGLKASDLVQVEDFAETLRNGETPIGGMVRNAPVLNIEHLDKLVLELERCHCDQEELQKKFFELEHELRESHASNHLMESATLEISRKLISVSISKKNILV